MEFLIIIFFIYNFQEWVVCRVHESKNNSERITCDDNNETELSALDEVFLSLDDDQEQEEISFP